MQAGKMDRRIKLRKCTRALDAAGQQIENWTDFALVWAKVTPISDGEKFGAGEVKAYATHRFQIRYASQIADIDPTWRIELDNKIYDISGCKEIGRREGWELTATARGEY